MEECPICLEPLTGTVVNLGCCKKQVHIQCYITRCPMCRAELPAPPNYPSQHVLVPIPMENPPVVSKWKIVVMNVTCCGLVCAAASLMFWPLLTRGPY